MVPRLSLHARSCSNNDTAYLALPIRQYIMLDFISSEMYISSYAMYISTSYAPRVHARNTGHTPLSSSARKRFQYTAGIILDSPQYHLYIQERRRFVPHGWSQFHEFSTADLNAGRAMISQACNSDSSSGPVSGPPWALITGLLASAVYGGRIDNSADMQVLEAYIALSLIHI